MTKFDASTALDLEKPIKKGTICASKFSVDNSWYRSKILRPLGKGEYEVEFIDFGNIDVVSQDDLKLLPQKILDFEPQAKQCSLAYINVHKIGDKFIEQGAQIIQEVALEKTTDAVIASQ